VRYTRHHLLSAFDGRVWVGLYKVWAGTERPCIWLKMTSQLSQMLISAPRQTGSTHTLPMAQALMRYYLRFSRPSARPRPALWDCVILMYSLWAVPHCTKV